MPPFGQRTTLRCLVKDENWAVSSPKCNKSMMILKEVERLWHKQFGGAPKVEALARSGIELPGRGIKFVLGEREQGHHTQLNGIRR